MHILLIVSWYKEDIAGTEGSFFEEQARGLVKLGHKVAVFYPDFIRFTSSKKPLYKEFLDAGIFTFCHKVKAIFPYSRKLNYWWVGKQSLKSFKKYVRRYGKPDLLHAHAFRYGGHVARYISKKTNIPYVVTEHFSLLIDPKGIKHSIDLEMARKVYRDSVQSFVVSHFYRQALAERLCIPQGNFQVLPNLVNPIFFREFKRIQLKTGDTVNFVHVANLVEVKNQKLLIDAFDFYTKNYYSCARLNIVGSGPLLGRLKEYVHELNLGNSVFFLGKLSREEVLGVLKKSHISLITSRIETFCVALIESLAVGRPVISTDCGGPGDIVHNKNGMIVESHQPEIFAKAMWNLMEVYQQCDQKGISDDCYDRFSEEKILDDLTAAYKRINVSKLNGD